MREKGKKREGKNEDKRRRGKKCEVGLELFTVPKRQNVSDVSVNGPRERSSDCSIEEEEGLVGSVIFIIRRNPRISPRHVDVVLFLLAAFRERIKEKEREGGNEGKSKRWSREAGGSRWERGVVSSLPATVYSLLYCTPTSN